MVNTIVFEYLKEHGEKYSLDDLKREILAKGYSEDEYYEALKELNARKLQPAEVAKLPSSTVVHEKRSGGGGVFKSLLLFLLVLMFVFGGLVLLNYLGISIFGFNLFDFF